MSEHACNKDSVSYLETKQMAPDGTLSELTQQILACSICGGEQERRRL